MPLTDKKQSIKWIQSDIGGFSLFMAFVDNKKNILFIYFFLNDSLQEDKNTQRGSAASVWAFGV